MEFITIKGEEFVVLGKADYERLVDDTNKLICLEAMGVDNWGGYDEAMAMMREENDCE